MDYPTSPKDLITQEAVVASVTTDFGPNAELLAWNIQDFTQSDDSHNSYVTSIQVDVRVNGEDSHHSYIAKLNPCRQSECWKCVTNSVFIREGYFLHDISPRLCNILTSYSQDPLRLPVDLYSSCAVGKEILISRDLREKDFVMVERRKGLDVTHAKLVLQELARLHAASFLLEEQNIGEELQDIYPFLQDEWGDDQHVYYEMFEKFTKNQLKHTIKLLQESSGYNKAISWIEDLSKRVLTVFKGHHQNIEPKFKVICHGDLQINNILFRYEKNNVPVEVMLLDLQRAKVSSVAADLNYFLYTSLDGKTRRENLNTFLQEYYDSFSTVMNGASVPMRFSMEDLKQEFHKKNTLGFIHGINAGINFLLESEGIERSEKDETDSKDETFKARNLVKNTLYEQRVTSLVDEMMDYNLIQ